MSAQLSGSYYWLPKLIDKFRLGTLGQFDMVNVFVALGEAVLA